MESSDQREFTRIPVEVRAEVTAGDTSITGWNTQNLSLKGMFLPCTKRLPEGSECHVTLFLGDGSIQIHAEGKVIQGYPEGLAIQFIRLLGLESLEHLRKLVLYNAADPDRVEQELNTSAGIQRKV